MSWDSFIIIGSYAGEASCPSLIPPVVGWYRVIIYINRRNQEGGSHEIPLIELSVFVGDAGGCRTTVSIFLYSYPFEVSLHGPLPHITANGPNMPDWQF